MADEYPPTIRRTKVDGVPVVKDEVLSSGLTAAVGRLVPIRGIRVLTLKNGEVVHGCRDCLFHGSRGEVKSHRIAEHGESSGGNRGGGRAGDGAGPAVAINPDTLAMSVGELLELAGYVGDWESVLENVQRQRDDALSAVVEKSKELSAERRAHNALKKRLKSLVGDV